MSVCVMRATGSIGSAIVKELMGAGHQMLGLTRSDAGAAAALRYIEVTGFRLVMQQQQRQSHRAKSLNK